MNDTRHEDYHHAIDQLIQHHEYIEPWFKFREEGLDTKRIKFYRCRGTKPLVHDTARVRGGLWMRTVDFHEDYMLEKEMNPQASFPERAHMFPASHILKLPEMQQGNLLFYDRRNLWTAVDILRDLVG